MTAHCHCVPWRLRPFRSHLTHEYHVADTDANRGGRDFVLGDVNGCFPTLDRALAELLFAASPDRLFGVGDPLGFGPYGVDAVDWIELRFEGSTGPLCDELGSLAPSDYCRWRDALRRLPLACLAVALAAGFGLIPSVSVETWRGPGSPGTFVISRLRHHR